MSNQKNHGPETSKDTNIVRWSAGEANPKQLLFYQATSMFVAYGGAKGGGKTHAVRIKAFLGACLNPGIRIIIFRQTFQDRIRDVAVLSNRRAD